MCEPCGEDAVGAQLPTMLVREDIVRVVASGSVILEVSGVLALVPLCGHVDPAVRVPGGHSQDVLQDRAT